ncbi:MAG: ribonuclease III [Sphingomonadales bacterium]
MTTKCTPIEKILNYKFKNKELLKVALTHPSLEGFESYQRLEFLGDRVLGLLVSAWIYEKYPLEKEGALSRRFIELVRKETLAEVAQNLKIERYIKISKTVVGQDGRGNPTILSDVVESLIGAMYLDGGLEALGVFIRTHWAEFLTRDVIPKDPKSALQEWAQGRGFPLPQYEITDRSGLDHQPIFTLKVSIKNQGEAIATGNSKRVAETEAAEHLLNQLNQRE